MNHLITNGLAISAACAPLMLMTNACEIPTWPMDTKGVHWITVVPESTVILVGESTQFRATGIRETCDVEFCSTRAVPVWIRWTSSDQTVATVSPDPGHPFGQHAIVLGIAPGRAIITAHADSNDVRSRSGEVRVVES